MRPVDREPSVPRATARVARLADPKEDVRKAAWALVTMLGAEETLAQHVAVIVAKLADSDRKVRQAARATRGACPSTSSRGSAPTEVDRLALHDALPSADGTREPPLKRS